MGSLLLASTFVVVLNTNSMVHSQPEAAPPPAAGPVEPPAFAVGKPAPPLVLKKLLQAPAGAPATLDGLRGKAVVLEFWGTWCAPCVAAFPHLNELVEQTRKEPIVFIAITDEPETTVAPFLARRALSTWVGLDQASATTLNYRVKAFPTTVLIDREGIVRTITHPSAVDATMLRSLVRGEPLAAGPVEEPRGAPAVAGQIDPAAAYYFVWIGPPTPGLGNPTTSAKFMRTPSTTVRSILQACYGVSGACTFFEEGTPADLEIAYEVRLPEDHPRTAIEALREALEASFGISARREAREMDVLVLTRPGEAGPTPDESGPDAPAMWMGDDRYCRAENSGMDTLTGWLERGLGKPVVDGTGLAGRFGWEFMAKEVTLPGYNAALGKIGLALTPERRTVEVVVVGPVRPAEARE